MSSRRPPSRSSARNPCSSSGTTARSSDRAGRGARPSDAGPQRAPRALRAPGAAASVRRGCNHQGLCRFAFAERGQELITRPAGASGPASPEEGDPMSQTVSTQPVSPVTTEPSVPLYTPLIADPGPVGLAAFAMTTFMLSVFNTNMLTGTLAAAVLPLALFYGGGV